MDEFGVPKKEAYAASYFLPAPFFAAWRNSASVSLPTTLSNNSVSDIRQLV
ncbi:hypothetical protein CA13_42850 [Planctomycetes bacterium CA13]|uniref:Uncharacterized protein n=1 Tax=Novipirellula herctigrandis TaxID=2527986 RepID=A0A5C5Z686_9BACT|nr:hypothetical protein CA13_42850 [Planctomycetes bacterium CA13]